VFLFVSVLMVFFFKTKKGEWILVKREIYVVG
jgi:hypothetical protein